MSKVLVLKTWFLFLNAELTNLKTNYKFKTFLLSTGFLFSYSLSAGMVFTGAEAQLGTSTHSGGAGLLITRQRGSCVELEQ